MITAIKASKDQTKKIYEKYLMVPLTNLKYTFVEGIGSVSCNSSIHNVKMTWQMRNSRPCFFELYIGDLRYDIYYPEGVMFNRLKKLGMAAGKKFWKGGQL